MDCKAVLNCRREASYFLVWKDNHWIMKLNEAAWLLLEYLLQRENAAYDACSLKDILQTMDTKSFSKNMNSSDGEKTNVRRT